MPSLRLPALLLFAVLALGTGPGFAQGAKSVASDPLARFRSSLVPPPAPSEIALRQSVYVPAYSSLVHSGGQALLNLSVTLSVRNTSPTLPLVVEHIDYYDTAGNLVQHYIPVTIAIRPFGTIEILIATNDVRGARGQISSWTGAPPHRPPNR